MHHARLACYYYAATTVAVIVAKTVIVTLFIKACLDWNVQPQSSVNWAWVRV